MVDRYGIVYAGKVRPTVAASVTFQNRMNLRLFPIELEGKGSLLPHYIHRDKLISLNISPLKRGRVDEDEDEDVL